MGPDFARVLGVRTWRAFDVDETGRVLAGCDATGSMQLVEIGTEGARQLTALPDGCSGRYLRGERAVVVEHDSGGNERGRLSLLRLDPPPEQPAGPDDLTPLVHDPEHRAVLTDMLAGRVVYRTNRKNGVDFDVLIRNVFSGEEEVVYDAGGMVLEATASPNSLRIAVRIAGDAPMSDEVSIVDTMPVTEDEHILAVTDPDEGARHAMLAWLDDDTLLVSTNRGREFTGIARFDVRGGEWTWLLTDDTHDLLGWASPDGSRILVAANMDGSSKLSVHDAANGELLHEVATPVPGWIGYPLPRPAWSPDSRFVSISFTAPTAPGDVLLIDLHTGQLHQPTDSSADLAGERLITPVSHRVSTSDGHAVPCFTYTPALSATTELHAPSSVGSVVVLLHGGPEVQAVQRFDPIVQLLAGFGHTVVVPNVRGSDGYGRGWYSADDGRRRLDVLTDLRALHEWLSGAGFDPRRMALWGGSYGGYLVLAGLAFQPDLWAAGVSIVGISSLVTFLENTASYRRAAREREYGSLADDRDFLQQASPLSKADSIVAPLLLIHGANDPRVPLSEAEQIAEAVRGHGGVCELLTYADEGHGLAKRTNRLDAYPRALSFVDRALRD